MPRSSSNTLLPHDWHEGCRRAAILILPVFFAVASPAPAAPPADSIAQRVLACTACHDDRDRQGRDAYYPRIAGKPEEYLFNQLVNFRDGRRFYALMTYLVDYLPEAYLREIAAHFASLDVPYPLPQRANVSAEVLDRGRLLAISGDAARNLPACADCHGAALTGIAPAIPGVVGLPREYLVAQLNGWRAGTRKALPPDCMADIAMRLSAEDITALSAFLSSQPVPPGAKAATATAARLPLECGGVPGPVPGSTK